MKGEQKDRKNTAVKKGCAVAHDGLVGGGQQFFQDLGQACQQRISCARNGEIAFAKGQAVSCREKHKRCNKRT